MQNEATVGPVDIDSQSHSLKTSGLAVASAGFAIMGPFTAGFMWILSFNNCLTMGSSFILALFSCGIAGLGLISGIKSLEQIKKTPGQLAGAEYAVVGIFTSVVWMFLIFTGLLLPGIYYVNS